MAAWTKVLDGLPRGADLIAGRGLRPLRGWWTPCNPLPYRNFTPKGPVTAADARTREHSPAGHPRDADRRACQYDDCRGRVLPSFRLAAGGAVPSPAVPH